MILVRVRMLIPNVVVGDAKALTMLGASAPRSDQSEPGLAPIVIPLPTLASYWGVGVHRSHVA